MKVLFIVNGLGLGNSTRCLSVINHLKIQGYECEVLCSGMAYVFFLENRKYVDGLHIQRALGYSSRNSNKLSSLDFLMAIPQNLLSIFSNFRNQKRLLGDSHYDLVVTDSDYSIFLVRLFVIFKLAAINNSFYSLENQNLLSNREKRKVRFHLLIEKIDYFLHRIFTDLTICPTFEYGPVKSSGKFKLVSPICRDSDLPELEVSHGFKKLLIMISGCAKFNQDILKRKIELFTGFEKRVFYPDENQRVSNRVEDILWCDFMLTNAGFSSLSESVNFCKPAIVIPLEGHSEQLINAKLFARKQFGLISSPEDCDEALLKFIKSGEIYSASLLANKKNFKGNAQACELLIDLMEQSNANLR